MRYLYSEDSPQLPQIAAYGFLHIELVSSLREELEALVDSEAQPTCWWGCEPWQSHIGGPREPGLPFAILAGESHRQIWQTKFWNGHLVQDILLVAAVQLLHGGEELIGSNSSDHLVPENADDCLNNSIYVV